MKLLLIFVAAGAALLGAQSAETEPIFQLPQEIDKLVAYHLSEINSLGAMLFELASQRFDEDRKANRKYLMSAHWQKPSLTFTDGEFTVISLPYVEHTEYGVRLYCNHYNSFVEYEADSAVNEGRYSEAEKRLRLLRHFGNEELWRTYDQKLDLLKMIHHNSKEDGAFVKYMELSNPPYSVLQLSSVRKQQPTPVTNLLEVILPQKPISQVSSQTQVPSKDAGLNKQKEKSSPPRPEK
jgi:hypothetical protein